MATTSQSDWTLETLKTLLDERHKYYGNLASVKEEAVKVALANAEKAVATAERNAERWRDNANEWRAAMTDRERTFLHKNMGIVIGGLSALALLIAIAEKFIK